MAQHSSLLLLVPELREEVELRCLLAEQVVISKLERETLS